MAVGGYTTAILVHGPGVPYWATIPAAGLLAGVGGVLIGIPALRLAGIYLALATFALALSIPPVLNHFDSFTGGQSGPLMAPALAPLCLDLSQEPLLYYLHAGVALALFAFPLGAVPTRTRRAVDALP